MSAAQSQKAIRSVSVDQRGRPAPVAARTTVRRNPVPGRKPAA